MYVTPETGDGWITHIEPASGEALIAVARFTLTPQFRRLADGRETDLVFAARSRLARMGINIVPLAAPELNGDSCTLRLRIVAAIRAYGLAAHLEHIVVPGLRVGRLVFCPDDNRLDSSEILQAIRDNSIQVPAGFSLDGNGYLIIRPQRQVFRFHAPLTAAEVTAIATQADGKDLLNRLQLRQQVEHIELPPNDGVVTACSMFLHRHYLVLRNLDDSLGFHLQAMVLDPITTRGTNIYLEFINRTEQLIINPSVAASVHPALEVKPRAHFWFGPRTDAESLSRMAAGVIPGIEQNYQGLLDIFNRLETAPAPERYSHRMMAVSRDPLALLRGAAPDALWNHPIQPPDPSFGTDMASTAAIARSAHNQGAGGGTEVLEGLEDGAGATLLLGYFPNLVEHTLICAAALRQRITRIVFRRASFEHGPFLSARDHGRLADYEGLGVEVFWCNESRGHVVRHIRRGLRGYFTTPDQVEAFRSSLIFAIYGSTRPLSEQATRRAERLLKNLRTLFGSGIGILTGGGPGAMQQITDIAHQMGLMVGSSYIETIDQEPNQSADFYQTFQARSRQARQRWFEIASFHTFLVGGVGTLEEVGLTLTDMKLGVIEHSPIVFFDGSGDGFYWDGLRQQLATMAEQGRVPAWLIRQILMTSDPDTVPAFYKETLRLG